MKIVVSGKQLDLGEALQRHASERLDAAVGKYFDAAIEAHAVFSRTAHMFHCDCLVHVGSGIDVKSEGEATEIYAAFDQALDRLAKQLRRDKRRRRSHQGGRKTPPAIPGA
jgi:ribosomal subunit interface protein